MCGRFALGLTPSQIQQMFADDNMDVAEAPPDDGPGAPRHTYNFAPGHQGVVYRAEGGTEAHDTSTPLRYLLQTMKWGLVPAWTKRKPDYPTLLKTINCRADSLADGAPLWNPLKTHRRCVVVAQGFYEWLSPAGAGPKVPHYVKRADGRLMCFAGLWDCVEFGNTAAAAAEDDTDGAADKTTDKLFSFTIVTTSSNAQLAFLHERMPVILDQGSDALEMWLDPGRREWTDELQGLLRPYPSTSESGDHSGLVVYPVSRDVGKVGNNSASFVVPVDSRENKANIANFFANAANKHKKGVGGASAAAVGSTAKTSVVDIINSAGHRKDYREDHCKNDRESDCQENHDVNLDGDAGTEHNALATKQGQEPAAAAKQDSGVTGGTKRPLAPPSPEADADESARRRAGSGGDESVGQEQLSLPDSRKKAKLSDGAPPRPPSRPATDTKTPPKGRRTLSATHNTPRSKTTSPDKMQKGATQKKITGFFSTKA